MPSVESTWTAIRDQLKTHIEAAWPEVGTIYYGERREEPESLPYVQVTLEPVEMPWATVQGQEQQWNLTIWGRFPYPVAPPTDLIAWKANKADTLIALLESTTGFANIAYLPHVSQFNPAQADDTNDVLDVGITFSCKTHAQRGS